MLVDHNPAGLQVHIVHGLAGDQLIVINFTVVNTVISVEICLTDSKQVGVVVRNDVFNLISFIFQECTASIPVAEFDPSVASITICVPGIEVTIRQYGGLKW